MSAHTFRVGRYLWILAGTINFILGVAVLIMCGPGLWGFRVPAEFLFAAVAPVGLLNIVLSALNGRFRVPALILNALCGITLGMFAAFQFESFFAWILTLLLCVVPSLVAVALPAQRR
jgi:amino acid transporter